MGRKYTIAIHGGAGDDSDYIRTNLKAYQMALEFVVRDGARILEQGGSAMDAVEHAIRLMEDEPLFNAGKGSALNRSGEAEMDASIMQGHDKKSGSVALLQGIKNPIVLARKITTMEDCVLLAGQGAIDLAKELNLPFEDQEYFVTPHQTEEFEKSKKKAPDSKTGTVGAVARDHSGHLAAGVSTGGLPYKRKGRIGDSAIIGAGCYADDTTCAVAGTGDGEYLIRGSISHHLSLLMASGKFGMQQACDYLIHNIHRDTEADMGIIAVDPAGLLGFAFNSERMHRASLDSDSHLMVAVYKNPF